LEGAPVKTKMPAGTAFTASAPLHKRLGDLPLVAGAYNFFSSASFNNSLPNISSASIRFNLAFSFSNSLSRLA
jgi:hypothetical protein